MSAILTLQVGELLLRGILARDHVLDDTLDRIQDHLIMAELQHRIDLGIQEAVTVEEVHKT